jgi:hypothetical protein
VWRPDAPEPAEAVDAAREHPAVRAAIERLDGRIVRVSQERRHRRG